MVMARFRRLSGGRKIYEGLRKLRRLLVRDAVYLGPFREVRRADRICITRRGRFTGQDPNDTLEDPETPQTPESHSGTRRLGRDAVDRVIKHRTGRATNFEPAL